MINAANYSRILIVCTLGGLLFMIGVYFYFLHYEPDRRRYPVRGIDVSHHQGDIDWQTVAQHDVAFAYIKATEGGDHKDKRFSENWAEARKAGIPRGAYHFFTLCKSGAEQAVNFIATVPAEPDALPPVADLEFGGNCANRPEGVVLTQELDVFLNRLEAHYGKRPVLYLTPEFYIAHIKGTRYAAEYPLWLRSILREPYYATERWALWQYHNRGRVKGITGPVDLNVRAP